MPRHNEQFCRLLDEFGENIKEFLIVALNENGDELKKEILSGKLVLADFVDTFKETMAEQMSGILGG